MTETPAENLTQRQLMAIHVALLVLTALAGASAAADAGAARAVLVLATAVLVPGWAVLTRLPRTDLLTSAALAVVISLALEICGSLVFGWVGWWHPWVLAVVLAAASAVLITYDLAGLLGARRRTV